MILKNRYNLKINFIFTITFVILSFFYSPIALASSYTVNPNCTGPGIPNTTCSNSATITLTATDKGVILGANSFDDWGTLTVTRPSSASSSLSTPIGFGPKSLAEGNIFGMFSEGAGTYTVTVWAQDTGGVGMGANALITVSTGPTCTLFASQPSVVINTPFDLIWTTTDASSASINNGVGAAAPIAGGSISATPAALGSTIYIMTAVDAVGVSTTCQATINVIPPFCTLTANPNGVFANGTTDLYWDIVGAATVPNASINNGVGTITPPSGNISTPPISADTTFILSFTGSNALSYSCSVNVGLIQPPTGGLIPCGRLTNDPATTDIDESQPCSLCAMFYLLKNIINFVMTLSVGIAVFILIMSGLFYALSAGNSRTIESAKSAAISAIIGIAIITVAWLVIAVILQGLGYASFTTWNQVSCILPT